MLKTILIWRWMVLFYVLGLWELWGWGAALLCLGGIVVGLVLIMALWRSSLPSANAVKGDHEGGVSE